jgi:hypothetical protein
MDELGNSASNQWILRERYSEHIIEYLRVRNINRPENKFHHAGLESVFSGFDAALSDFSHFLGGFYAADKNTDYGSYLVPNADDKYSQWARESQKQLMVKYFIAEEQHKKVVEFVKKFMPEFEFTTEHGR